MRATPPPTPLTRRPHLAIVIVAAVLGAACGSDGRTLRPPQEPAPTTTTLVADTLPAEPTPPPQIELFTSWQDGAAIPTRHTCDGLDIAPALTWSSIPPGTIELAITVTDLDAAGFAHWIVYGLDPALTSLVEGQLPDTALVWPNSYGNRGWDGPCPPPGQEHRYLFTVHALNQQLEVADDASSEEVITELNNTSIAQRSVSGTYVRAKGTDTTPQT